MSGNWAAGFFRSMLSDKDGTVSNTRVLLCMIVCHVLGWVSALVMVYIILTILHHGTITMTDIVTFMGAATTFATSLGGVLMLIKTGGDVANNRAPGAPSPLQPPD